MIKFFLYGIGISTFLFICLILGENYVDNFPESKFSQWWRKNVVAEDPENRDF
jgi:hypothetical protein